MSEGEDLVRLLRRCPDLWEQLVELFRQLQEEVQRTRPQVAGQAPPRPGRDAAVGWEPGSAPDHGAPEAGRDARPLAYSVQEAARLLQVGENTLREAIRRGQVPHLRIGRRVVIPKAALDRWLAGAGDAS